MSDPVANMNEYKLKWGTRGASVVLRGLVEMLYDDSEARKIEIAKIAGELAADLEIALGDR